MEEIRSKDEQNSSSMLLRTPNDGTRFASVWIGAKLADWSGMGTYDLVSQGPAITKDSSYWW